MLSARLKCPLGGSRTSAPQLVNVGIGAPSFLGHGAPLFLNLGTFLFLLACSGLNPRICSGPCRQPKPTRPSFQNQEGTRRGIAPSPLTGLAHAQRTTNRVAHLTRGRGRENPYALAVGGDLSPSPTSRTREEQEGRKALGPSVRRLPARRARRRGGPFSWPPSRRLQVRSPLPRSLTES